MDRSINLIGGKTFDVDRELRRLRILKTFSIVSIVLVALIAIVLFLITLLLPISAVKQDEQQTLTNISLLHKKLVNYFLVSDRINNISQIIAKRKTYGSVSSAILKKVPQELSVDTLSIEDNTLTIVLTGSSLLSVNKAIDDMVLMANDKKIIKNLLIESLVLNSSVGKYSLSMKADIL